ncbi:MAG: isopentenyl phosphate kinase [Thermoproteota archaeon]|nr:isopentenyl phosphate kinase [Thermoproteota archaeon]
MPSIRMIVKEILKAEIKSMVIVHGGGSYGHPVAKEFRIAAGYNYPNQLIGFSKTRQAMMALNKLIIDAFIQENLSAVSVQPSAFLITNKGRIGEFDSTVVKKLLGLGIIPILFGDAVLDSNLGFSILSGDQLVSALALALNAKRIIVCVDVDGLYNDDPKLNPQAELIKEITLNDLKGIMGNIGASKTVDVTGGMYGKMVELIPALEKGVRVKIINTRINRLYKTLKNKDVIGTEIRME